MTATNLFLGVIVGEFEFWSRNQSRDHRALFIVGHAVRLDFCPAVTWISPT